MKNTNIPLLWQTLLAIDSIEERKVLIYTDTLRQRRKLMVLAKEDPFRLFELLGGEDEVVELQNWANEYTYEEFIEDNGLKYSQAKAKKWNLEKESIAHAHELGYWSVTGVAIIEGPNGIELPFEFSYSEGYRDDIIATPYNFVKDRKYGIPFT
jgi:hypothetical protein